MILTSFETDKRLRENIPQAPHLNLSKWVCIFQYVCSAHSCWWGCLLTSHYLQQSLWSFKDMTNTWRIHKACQILFGRLKSVADLLFWSLSAWQCVSLTGLFQQGSLMCCVAEEKRDTGEWRSIGVEINGYHVRQMLAPLSRRVSTIGKDSWCLIIAKAIFIPWKKLFCTLMCVSLHVCVRVCFVRTASPYPCLCVLILLTKMMNRHHDTADRD